MAQTFYITLTAFTGTAPVWEIRPAALTCHAVAFLSAEQKVAPMSRS